MRQRLTPRIEADRVSLATRNCPTEILSPQNCIELALSEHPDCVVSWSGGKCSTVVLHMVLQIKPDIRVIFNDTGVEFPETYAFVRTLSGEWKLNLRTLKPETTFWRVVEKYGFPMLREEFSRRKRAMGLSKKDRPMCCELLKEKPLLRAGIECCITGVRASESRTRMFTIAKRGQYYYAKSLKRWNFHPIAFWTDAQVWKYHEEYGILHNKIYDMGHSRCGCWPCTGFVGWRESLSKSHPAMHKVLMKMYGEPTLWEFDDVDNCRQEPAEE